MSLTDVTGVFSRYFIVGFFVPTFFSLALLKLALSREWLPKAVEPATGEAFLVLGALALLIGLILLGLRDPIVYIMSGYLLVRDNTSWWYRPIRAAGEWMRGRLLREFTRLQIQAKPSGSAETSSEHQMRRRAEWLFDIHFSNSPEKVLPTRFGNRIRAAEDHARKRWFLETVVVWPRINTFLSEQESKLHADAETDVAFFLNSALALTLAGSAMVLDAVIHDPRTLWLASIYVLLFVLAYLLYLAAVGAAERWGRYIRASIDLHREDLYRKLGVRVPSTDKETRDVGVSINRLLLYGDRLPDTIRAVPSPGGDTEPEA